MDSCNYGQHMVDRPKFDSRGVLRKPKDFKSSNQVMSKSSGLIRPDKRKKARYL